MTELSNPHWQEIKVRRGFAPISDVYAMVGERGYIAGSYAGYMSSLDIRFQPNDVDIFAISNDAADSLYADLRDKLGYCLNTLNDVAIGLSKFGVLPVQIVRPAPDWQTFPDDILNSFDMNICRGVLITPTMLLGDQDLGLHFGKLLRLHNPLRTLKRVMKYQARGVQFNDHELLKLFRAWQEMDVARQDAMLNTAHAEAFPVGSSEDDYEDWYEDDDDWFEGE